MTKLSRHGFIIDIEGVGYVNLLNGVLISIVGDVYTPEEMEFYRGLLPKSEAIDLYYEAVSTPLFNLN